jgi:hypothetical protein
MPTRWPISGVRRRALRCDQMGVALDDRFELGVAGHLVQGREAVGGSRIHEVDDPLGATGAVTSRIAWLAPLEPTGYMGWAASPSRVTRPKNQPGGGVEHQPGVPLAAGDEHRAAGQERRWIRMDAARADPRRAALWSTPCGRLGSDCRDRAVDGPSRSVHAVGRETAGPPVVQWSDPVGRLERPPEVPRVEEPQPATVAPSAWNNLCR